jgi:hypothetical protein
MNHIEKFFSSKGVTPAAEHAAGADPSAGPGRRRRR